MADYLRAWKGTLGAIIVLIIAAIAIAYVLVRPVPPANPPLGQEEEAGETIAVQGRLTCLPHKDTSGPQTLECAIGLETPEGVHYALDLSAYTGPQGFIEGLMDKDIEVKGVFTPVEELSGDILSVYAVVGVVFVQSMGEASAP